jgi:hypothetical protein
MRADLRARNRALHLGTRVQSLSFSSRGTATSFDLPDERFYTVHRAV